MPHILMIATGGTIACCETAHGLSPALDSAALLGALPELSALCTVETLDLMQLDSTDVTAADRQRIQTARQTIAGGELQRIVGHVGQLASASAFCALMWSYPADASQPFASSPESSNS